MDGIYAELLNGLSDLPKEETIESSIDGFLSENRVKLSSIDDLFNFIRIGEETLVHKAEKDLWRISEANGNVVIERLFDPNTNQALKV